jgi:quercetin dioxygenase-like cupin family protein
MSSAALAEPARSAHHKCTPSGIHGKEQASMSEETLLRFVGANDITTEESPWGLREPLCHPGLTDAKLLYLVRMNMPPGHSHPFHRHPEMEEIIYVLSGRAEQWVGEESRILGPGDVAHIPQDGVHATYNAGPDMLVFLAILSPAASVGPTTVDVSMDAPWNTLRAEAKHAASG